MRTHLKSSNPVTTIGLDIGKNTFHLIGLDKRGAISMRIKLSRNQLVRRLVTCLPASSAWRPAVARITLRARLSHSDMTIA
jgi:hypothetical protein